MPVRSDRCAKFHTVYINPLLSTSEQPFLGTGAHSKAVEVLMPNYLADETSEHPLVNLPALLELTAIDRTCIKRLIGHTLARIEREFILQTLRWCQGNRTRAADRLGISVRSLRDRIRNYRYQGESVPEPRDGARQS
jgi:DNA-binding NtrC family response regulator